MALTIYFTVLCSYCHRYFAMKFIKSEYKVCPSCGKSVKWAGLKKKKMDSFEEALEFAIHLNERLVNGDLTSLSDLLK